MYYLYAVWSSKRDRTFSSVAKTYNLPSLKKKTFSRLVIACFVFFFSLLLLLLFFYVCQDRTRWTRGLLITFARFFFRAALARDQSWGFKIGVLYFVKFSVCVSEISLGIRISVTARRRNGELSGSEDRWSLTFRMASSFFKKTFSTFFWEREKAA